MSIGLSVAIAVVFVWLGMVLAISFLEAPLKFRAPGVTLQIGLGIGRLVFRALNACEAVFAVAILVAMLVDPPPRSAIVAFVVVVGALVIQLGLIRPALVRRSNTVLGGDQDAAQSRSRVHYVYVLLEAIKVVGLLVTGILLLGVCAP